jgi:hypothetical protein
MHPALAGLLRSCPARFGTRQPYTRGYETASWDIRVYVDRPDFTLNPTSCEPMSVLATVLGSSGAVASLSNRFQVGGCAGLGFKPKLSLALKGATKRNDNPALRAVVDYEGGPGYANIARAVVALPHSEFLDQAHIRTVCTRVQFAAKQCPKGSIYGQARAVTPLLDQPLEGPVYLRSSSHLLPDLVVALSGPETLPVEINLVGRVDTKDGGIRTSSSSVPDAPVTKFVVSMQGGRKGLLVNSTNLCLSAHRAHAGFTAHNGKVHDTRPVVKPTGCPKHSKKKH